LLNLPHGRAKALKILLADRDRSRGASLAAQLQAQDDAFTIIQVSDEENLLEAVRRDAPDVVLVDMSRSDRDGLDSVRILNAQQSLPVLMFVDDDDPAFMEEAIAAGVTSYHVYDVALPAIKPILRTAMAFFKRTQQMSNRLAEAEQEIAARQTIEAAKRILMSRDGLSEPAAHRFLQRRAMDQQKKLVDVAAALLQSRVQEQGKMGKQNG
jgi:response regulator NasT